MAAAGASAQAEMEAARWRAEATALRAKLEDAAAGGSANGLLSWQRQNSPKLSRCRSPSERRARRLQRSRPRSARHPNRWGNEARRRCWECFVGDP
eukprot:SAG22_NODE_5302_length_1041_cov_5.042463_2_plen_96_part_00